MTKPKLEKVVVNNIRDYIKEDYPTSVVIKIHGGMFQAAGIPDLICCINGQFVGIEVKLPGKEKNLTKIQQHWIDLIKKAGGVAFMATSVEQVKEMLDKCLD